MFIGTFRSFIPSVQSEGAGCTGVFAAGRHVRFRSAPDRDIIPYSRQKINPSPPDFVHFLPFTTKAVCLLRQTAGLVHSRAAGFTGPRQASGILPSLSARGIAKRGRCIACRAVFAVLIQFSAETWIRSSTRRGLPPSAMNWSMAACSSTWNSSRHSPFSMM